jgi:hypothetical protein
MPPIHGSVDGHSGNAQDSPAETQIDFAMPNFRGASGKMCELRHTSALSKKCKVLPGQVKQSGFGGYSALSALHQLRRDCRVEHPLVARPTSGDLFICAKHLFVEAMAALRRLQTLASQPGQTHT